MLIGPEQSTCGNEDCPVIIYNPSLPDGGMSTIHAMDEESGGTPLLRERMPDPTPALNDINGGYEMHSPQPGRLVTLISTALVRTRGGEVVHRTTCATLADATTMWPWLWAEGRPLEEVRRAAAMVGSRPCAICKPFANPKAG